MITLKIRQNPVTKMGDKVDKEIVTKPQVIMEITVLEEELEIQEDIMKKISTNYLEEHQQEQVDY